MFVRLKDIIYTFSRRFKIKRLNFNDLLINCILKIRWNILNIIKSPKIKNYSNIYKKDLILTFDDDFNSVNWDYNGIDKWKIGEGWGLVHPKKLNVYYGPPKIKSNKTFFTCEYKPKEFIINGEKIVVPYEVSLLSSERWFKQQYGRFECRMTLPDAPHSWPAFWMWGTTWPPEIDIIEAYGRNTGKEAVYQEINIHYGSDGKNRLDLRPWLLKIDKKKNLSKNFYEFAVEWKPNRIDFFTNGIRVFQYTNKEILNKWLSSSPMWMIINNSIRNYDEHNPYYFSEFEVDYIRSYKFKNI